METCEPLPKRQLTIKYALVDANILCDIMAISMAPIQTERELKSTLIHAGYGRVNGGPHVAAPVIGNEVLLRK